VVVYGHYDVQPADPLNLWDSPPFEPVIKKTEIHPEGAIFARGACDDKGQMYMHVKAFEVMMKTGTLPCNVKFMIEDGDLEQISFHPCEKDMTLANGRTIIASLNNAALPPWRRE
jgi:hypothetical protein